MKLQHEDVGSHILMSLPQVIVHRIDQHSPLLPPALWYDAQGRSRQYPPSVEACGETVKGNDKQKDELAPAEQQYMKETECLEDFVRDRATEIVVLVEGTDELTGAAIQTRHSYTFEDLAWNQSFVPCVFPFNEDQPDDESRRCGWRALFLRRRRARRGPPLCVIDFARFHETEAAPLNSHSCPHVIE
jgi:hypothetical protein